MTDERSSQVRPDSDLNIKGVVAVGIGLAIATALGALISWWLALALRHRLEAQDPPPPVLIEAQMPFRPPSPNLQTDPAGELAAMRAEEAAILQSFAWSDAAETAARVPIERAMTLLLETRSGAEAFATETNALPTDGTSSGGATGDEGDDES